MSNFMEKSDNLILTTRMGSVDTGKQENMDMVFKDVCVNIGSTPILKGINGSVKSGEMLVILGPSGAGKTTFMNTLSGRIPVYVGSVTVNNKRVNKQIKRMISYVVQENMLFPQLTLRNTLIFSARLLMRQEISENDKMKKVYEIVDYLELTHCLDTLIGGDFVPGLSGGEKKRANLACELLRDPEIILLDEPTSGLDIVIAFKLINLLHGLAKDLKKVIITTLHQPSSEIFYTFDKVLLLNQGQNAYFGNATDVLSYFQKLDLRCFLHYNPADFILEMVKDPNNSDRILEAAKMQRYADEWPDELRRPERPYSEHGINDKKYVKCRSTTDTDPFELEVERKWTTSFWRQYLTLCHRHLLLSKFTFLAKTKIASTVVLALLGGMVFYQLSWTENHLKSREGLWYFSMIYFMFDYSATGMILYLKDRPVIIRERCTGAYRISAYHLAMLTTNTLFMVFHQFIFTTIIYLMTTVNPRFDMFLAHLGLLIFGSTVPLSFASIIGVTTPSVFAGLFSVYLYMTLMKVSGGYFIDKMYSGVSWFQHVPHTFYHHKALVSLEYLNGRTTRCAPLNTTMFEVCRGENNTSLFIPGSVALEHLKAPSMALCIGVLIGYTSLYSMISYLCIRYSSVYRIQLQKIPKRKAVVGNENGRKEVNETQNDTALPSGITRL